MGKIFCLRGGKEHRDLKFSQLQRQNDHWKYTEHGSKNFRGGLADLVDRIKWFGSLFVPLLETVAMWDCLICMSQNCLKGPKRRTPSTSQHCLKLLRILRNRGIPQYQEAFRFSEEAFRFAAESRRKRISERRSKSRHQFYRRVPYIHPLRLSLRNECYMCI